jgi:DNA-binding transcriptional MerR regulator
MHEVAADDPAVKGPWLTTEQLAERMHQSPNTVRYWTYQGTGPASTKFGHRRLYRLSDVEAWEADVEAKSRQGAA